MSRTCTLGALFTGALAFLTVAPVWSQTMVSAPPPRIEPRTDTGLEDGDASSAPSEDPLRSMRPGPQPPGGPGSRDPGSTRSSPTVEPEEETSRGRTHPGRAYVGILVEPVDPALRAHLVEPLGTDQGILVRHVEPGTPGSRAGLEEFDILLAFGEKTLTAPRDLVNAVRDASPGEKVMLKILRAGKPRSFEITLGELDSMEGLALPRLPRGHPPVTPREDRDEEEPEEPESTTPSFPSLRPSIPRSSPTPQAPGFEALSIRNLEGDLMQIEYTFQGESSDTGRYTFRGTPDEIKKQVEANPWLSDERKQSLLQALEMARRATGLLGGGHRPFMPQGLAPHLEPLFQQDSGTRQTY